MKDEGGAIIGLVVIVGIIKAILDGIGALFLWLGTDWHWLQIAAPVAVIGILTVVCWEKIEESGDGFMVLWGIFAVSPFALWLWRFNFSAGADFIDWLSGGFFALPIWLIASVVCLLYFPAIGIALIVQHQNDLERINEFNALRKRKTREPFGSAGKATDEKLKNLGVI